MSTWTLRPSRYSTIKKADGTLHDNEITLGISHSNVDKNQHLHVDVPRFASVQLFRPWFPEVDSDHPQAQSLLKKLSSRKITLILHQIVSSTILFLNSSLTLALSLKYGLSTTGAEIIDSSCSTIHLLDSFAHLFINIISTLLLGCSNYCAQLLASPTRNDVDRAHRRKDWLEIGVPSFRNMMGDRLSRRVRVAWLMLLVTSTVLHLFWNSAVYSTTSFSGYHIALVAADFTNQNEAWTTTDNQTLALQRQVSVLTRLSKEDCVNHYVNKLAGAGDVVVVAANITSSQNLSLTQNPASALLWDQPNTDGALWIFSSEWMCSAFEAKYGERSRDWCTLALLQPQLDQWTLTHRRPSNTSNVLSVKVDYCLTTGESSLDQQCSLKFSPIVGFLVCVLNTLKCACIWYTARLHTKSQSMGSGKEYLVTTGDAIASFLEHEDSATQDMTFVGRHDFKMAWPDPTVADDLRLPKRSIRWMHTASKRRWIVAITSASLIMATAIGLLCAGVVSQRQHGLNTDLVSLFDQGLGAAQSYAVFAVTLWQRSSKVASFYGAILFANMWQVLFSAAYLLYNGLFTTMTAADEWNGFIHERKTLRCSAPKGIQRGAYFLSLPLRYSIPLLAASSLLHWLISQSVFVVQTAGYQYSTYWYRKPDLDSSMVGYSLLGVILSLIVGAVMLVGLLAVGYFSKLRPRSVGKEEPFDQRCMMPLAATCSAAISAACHRPAADVDAHLLPVQWGAVDGSRWCFSTARDLKYPCVTNIGHGKNPSTEAEGMEPETLPGNEGFLEAAEARGGRNKSDELSLLAHNLRQTKTM